MEIPIIAGYRWLYAIGWWDGILSGVLEWQGKRYFANCVRCSDEEEELERRIFHVYDMPEEWWIKRDEKQQLWETHVGTHWNYDENGKRTGVVRPKSEWHKFYDIYPPDAKSEDYTVYPVIGQFEI